MTESYGGCLFNFSRNWQFHILISNAGEFPFLCHQQLVLLVKAGIKSFKTVIILQYDLVTSQDPPQVYVQPWFVGSCPQCKQNQWISELTGRLQQVSLVGAQISYDWEMNGPFSIEDFQTCLSTGSHSRGTYTHTWGRLWGDEATRDRSALASQINWEAP